MPATLGGLGIGLYRATFMFNYKNMGWSETWWHDGTSIAELIQPIIAYTTARLGFQPFNVELGGVRVSQEGQSRKSRLFVGGFNDGDITYSGFTLPRTGSYVGPSGILWDIGQQAVQCEVLVEGIRAGFRYVAILPDQVSTTNPETINFGIIPSWRNAFLAYTAMLRAQNWKIRITQATSLRPEVPINGWIRSTDDPANWSFVLVPQAALPGVSVGKYVHVRGARMQYSGLPSPNGKWRVVKDVQDNAAGTRTVTLAKTAGLNLQYLVSQGVVYLDGVDYFTPSLLSPWAVTRHKRGGPFPRERGRRSKPRFPPS